MYQILANIPPSFYFLKDASFQSSKKFILEPICCLFKLILYQYKPENTKLSIQNNSILYTEGNSLQPMTRLINGDCREDLHNIYYPLIKCTEWYPIDEYYQFYSECKKGLEILNNVYSDNTTIHHTIVHFISVIDKSNSLNELKKEKNPLIDELKPFWDIKEIELLKSYLELINNNISKDIYLKSLENIICEKEKKIYDFIQKISTSY